MTKSLQALFLSLLLCTLGCANIVPPDGGEKDNEAPRLLSVSPPDSSLNIQPTKIIFTFHEFVNVEQAVSEVQISPLILSQIKMAARKRKVVMSIPAGAWQPNTTYTINLGRAVKDFHEGNTFDGGNYIFSTGAYFDSLLLNGQVLNAETGLTDTGTIKILLYDAEVMLDSAMRSKPKYVTNTNSNGGFQFKGLPLRTFHIIGLRDLNNNLLYDGGNESIGFYDHTISTADTTLYVRLHIFQQDTIPDTNSNNGGFSNAQRGERKSGLLRVEVDTTDLNKRSFDITKPLRILRNDAKTSFNFNKLILTYDSANVIVEQAYQTKPDTSNSNQYLLYAPWKENTIYRMRLTKGFAIDSSGAENIPFLFAFRTKRSSDYASLEVHVPDSLKNNNYILEIISLQRKVYSTPLNDTVVEIKWLLPGDYHLHLVSDLNKNGKWDNGNFDKRQQPEPVIPFANEEKLKAGWNHIVEYKIQSQRSRQSTPKP